MTATLPFDVRVTQGLQAYFKQPSGPSRAGTDWAVSLTGPEGERRIIVRTYSDEIGELSQEKEVQIVLAYVGRLLETGWLPAQYRGEPGELVAGGGSPAPAGETIRKPEQPTALSIIRAGVIGVAAVVLPSAMYGAALLSLLHGVEPFFSFLAVALVLSGALAWTCVRVAHFSNRLAVILTTLPFMASTLLTVSALFSSAPAGFLLQAVILATAVGVSRGACHLARR